MGEYAVLVILDLTAAFDKVDHAVLISWLEHCVGITGSAMEWFKSYFSIEAFQLSLESIPQVMLYYRVGFLRVPSWPQ